MLKKKYLLTVILIFLLGFHLMVQTLGQTPFVTTRNLEFNRSAWTLYTPRDYESGDSLLAGDYLYPNLTICSYDRNVTISDFKQIEAGEVIDNFYPDSPLYIYYNNLSVISYWWLYWLNSSYLALSPPNMQFNLPLDKGGKSFLNSLIYLEGDWIGNETLLTDSPLTMSVNQINNTWVLSGSDNYNTTDNHLVNRSLSLIYDMNGYLLLLEGDTYFAYSIYFHRYHFSWKRGIKMTTKFPLESSTDESMFSFLLMSIIIGVIFLSRLKRK